MDFDFNIFGHGTDPSKIPDSLRGMLNELLRKKRRDVLSQGDQSHETKDPLERIALRLIYILAKDGEEADKIFHQEKGEPTFVTGSVKWLNEPDITQAVFIVLGAQMALLGHETMSSLLKDFGFDEDHLIEFARQELDHIKRHDTELKEAVDRATTPLDAESVMQDVEEHLRGGNGDS